MPSKYHSLHIFRVTHQGIAIMMVRRVCQHEMKETHQVESVKLSAKTICGNSSGYRRALPIGTLLRQVNRAGIKPNIKSHKEIGDDKVSVSALGSESSI